MAKKEFSETGKAKKLVKQYMSGMVTMKDLADEYEITLPEVRKTLAAFNVPIRRGRRKAAE